jgi:sporulation protein YlmC with PRC-barrel domain
MALSEQIQQRSDLIGTQVITRNTGKKLGVVNQVWVDIDQREVVAFGLRSTLITGEQRYIDLRSVRQIGDVILVDDEDALDEVNTYDFSTLINHEVVTESGELLGKVRGFKFDTVSGKVTALVIASLGIPLIPTQVISTYELPIEEIVSTGTERIIVFEGAEGRLVQLSVGVLERLGLTAPPWEDEDENYIPTRTPASNQLASGQRTQAYAPPQRVEVREREMVEVDDWESQPAEPHRAYVDAPNQSGQPKLDRWEEDSQKDFWEDTEAEEAYEAQPLKLPERQKVAEYEREEY